MEECLILSKPYHERVVIKRNYAKPQFFLAFFNVSSRFVVSLRQLASSIISMDMIMRLFPRKTLYGSFGMVTVAVSTVARLPRIR